MTEAQTMTSGRRRRAGGRDAKRAERTAQPGGSITEAFIKREIPTFDLVSEETLVKIEETADTILEEIGIEFRNDQEALQLWKAAGADIDGERVRFPKGLVQALCKTAPSAFRQHARNPARDVMIGGDNIVLSPAYGSPFIHNLDEGRRYASLKDFGNFVKLAYMSPDLHHSGGTICEPVDIPVNKRHLDMVYAHLRWSDKAMMGSVTAPDRAADSIEMCRIVFGADVVDRDCVILGNINVNSPLVYDATMTGALRTYAAANQCTVVVPFILGGAMGPVTSAGAIAQAHAETLVGVALTQLVRPGAPAIYGNFLSSMALRSGSPTFGTPEPALGSLVVGQLARRANLPLRCSGAFTMSKLPDGQAMLESAVSMQAAILCGANFILHSAGWLEGGLAMGYEKFMMDADYCGSVATYMKGIRIDDDTLGLDAFREVGPGKHFFGSQHTLRHYETAFWDSTINDNTSYEQWRDAGGWPADKRANALWKERLEAYEAPAIDPGVDEALRDFIDRKKRSMEDAWY